MNINIEVRNDNELNQVISQYLSEGYKIESNIAGTVVLKKKGYNLAILIILLLLGIIFGLIYYLICDDDFVTITNRSASSYSAVQNNSQEFESYCVGCGAGLKKDDMFCPNCGKKLDKQLNSEEVPKISE